MPLIDNWPERKSKDRESPCSWESWSSGQVFSSFISPQSELKGASYFKTCLFLLLWLLCGVFTVINDPCGYCCAIVVIMVWERELNSNDIRCCMYFGRSLESDVALTMNHINCRSQSSFEGVTIAKFKTMLWGLTRRAVTSFCFLLLRPPSSMITSILLCMCHLTKTSCNIPRLVVSGGQDNLLDLLASTEVLRITFSLVPISASNISVTILLVVLIELTIIEMLVRF